MGFWSRQKAHLLEVVLHNGDLQGVGCNDSKKVYIIIALCLVELLMMLLFNLKTARKNMADDDPMEDELGCQKHAPNKVEKGHPTKKW